MKRIICICDREPEYALSLMEIVNHHKSLPFEMKAFSNRESLLRYLEEEIPEVLLISPTMYCREIREREIPHTFFLSDSLKAPSEWSLPQINKYQRVDRILQILLEKVEPVASHLYSPEEPRLIAVYSPLHRVGKTTFSLALCQELNRVGKALYINMEDMSGFEEAFAQEYESDLTDLLYYARASAEKFPMYLAMIARDVQGMEFIPPARVPMELKAVRLEEWQSFLKLLRGNGTYDTMILDMGDGIQGLAELLVEMDRIYMPIAADTISQSKLRQYETMMEIMEYTDVLAHTMKLSLPQIGILRESGNYMQELLWGPMSGYVRELLETQESTSAEVS